MVVIRLKRGGAKRRPFYRILASDCRFISGNYIERLGYFNPISPKRNDRLSIDLERMNALISNGAKLSNRVKSLVLELNKSKI